MKALAPAQVREVRLHADTGTAEVIVPDFQLSLAIGKEGQNARLAARLTGWRIDIKSETQLAEEEAGGGVEYAEGEWVTNDTGELVWQPAEGGEAISAAEAGYAAPDRTGPRARRPSAAGRRRRTATTRRNRTHAGSRATVPARPAADAERPRSEPSRGAPAEEGAGPESVRRWEAGEAARPAAPASGADASRPLEELVRLARTPVGLEAGRGAGAGRLALRALRRPARPRRCAGGRVDRALRIQIPTEI